MTYEYYAALDSNGFEFPEERVWNLTSGYVDRATVDARNETEEARVYYREHVSQSVRELPTGLALDMDPPVVSKRWMSIVVDFTLTTPWYSKDDRPFHVLDNPLRKDRVFGVPFMSAASWKGLLRWACRMEAGLLEHQGKHEGRMQGWSDPDWIVHLFGNERGEGEELSRGALQFFPTWFDRIGFEVINPHGRETRAGTQPIVYEVVPAGTSGRLSLLYAPAPRREGPPETMSKLVRAIEKLLTVYGFSAKRTAGWGTATVDRGNVKLAENSELGRRLGLGGSQNYEPPTEAFSKLLEASGHPLDVLRSKEDGSLISKRKFGKLPEGTKPTCTNREFDAFKAWYGEDGDACRRRLTGDDERELFVVVPREFKSLGELSAALKEVENPRSGGDQ